MLSAFRAFTKSWAAKLLLVLLIASFGVFGIRDVFHTRVSDAVITAGPRTVSSEDFRREFQNLTRRAEQESGQTVTPEIAAANGLDREVLEGMATHESFDAWLHKVGVRPSDELIAQQIRKIPAFFDPVSGRFDEKRYRELLAQNNLTPDRFLGMIRDDLAERQMVGAVLNGMAVPRAYASLAAIYSLESRDVAFLTIAPTDVPQPAMPTDAQLNDLMKQHSAQLMQPEFRVLTVVRFSPQLVGANLPLDPAKLQQLYNFRKDTLSTPETRTIEQIPAKSPAAAQQIAARLQAGESPAAIAKSVGVEAIAYDNKPQSAIADRRLATAAFQMKPGQVQAVQGDLGTSVIKVASVTPGHAVTFEEARPALEAELRKTTAADKVYALTQAYDAAHQKGANLTEAAQKAGVPAMTLGPVARDGRDQQGQPLTGLSQKLMDTAFQLPAGGESDVVDAGNGEFFAVRVEKVLPPAMPTLAAIKPQLTRAYMVQQLTSAMQAKADGLAARVRKGESLQAVAASAGAHVTQLTGLTRQSAGQNQQVSQEVLGNTFNGKSGDVFTARDGPAGIVVGQIGKIGAGDLATVARMTDVSRPQMTQTVLREIGDSAQRAARVKMKTKIDYARARAAIGLAPEKPAAAAPGLAK